MKVMFATQIISWQKKHGRHGLPWQNTRDAYRVWLSEIMLQQTRVAVVIPYYERFLANFPTIQALANAPQEDVLRSWSGLGYYSRARNLQSAARRIVERHGGEFPAEETAALALPGIGKYTSAAVLSIAHDQKLAVLDGNVARVIARLFAIRGDLREGKRWQELQSVADKLLAANSAGDWNQAMMELGAIVCTPRSPQCPRCPVNQFCQARKLGLTGSIPEKRKKRAPVDITLACVIFRDPQGRTLLLPPAKKSAETTQPNNIPALLSHLWHFPTMQIILEQSGGKKAAETAIQLRLYLKSVIKRGKVPILTPLKEARHTVTFRKITVLPFLAHVAKLPTLRRAKTLPLSALSSLPISNLTRKAAAALAS